MSEGMLYIYTDQNGRVQLVLDEHGQSIEAGNGFEERDASILRDCTRCGQKHDPELRNRHQIERDSKDDELRCVACHEDLPEPDDDDDG